MLVSSGLADADCHVRISAAMRYIGQGYEVEVPVAQMDVVTDLPQRLAAEFDRCYIALYGRIEKDTPAEIVSWRVVVSGPTPNLTPALPSAPARSADSLAHAADALKGQRRVYSVAQGDFVATSIYDRYRLDPGDRLDGPAIIEERESTVVVPDGATVTVDAYRNLLIELPVKAY